MGLKRLKLSKFTAFESLVFEPSPGINVLIGENGVGKTHLLKVLYAACDITKNERTFSEKLVGVFLPSKRALGRLVRRQQGSSFAKVEVESDESKISCTFSNQVTATSKKQATTTGVKAWNKQEMESVFIPVKEMLANAPGFRSLYSRREVHFEEIYLDIIDRAFLPVLRNAKPDPQKAFLLKELSKAMNGKVKENNEVFFLSNKQGLLEFTLLAEGLRKFGLLWLLIQNGVLAKGSVLFWDEPEANLNPKLFSVVVKILVHLQRTGVQVFVATHDYAILKEFDLAVGAEDQISYGALYRPTPNAGVEMLAL